MAATGFTPIQLYRTATAAAAPTAGNLADGELAINTLDEKLYFKNSAGAVKLLAANVTPAANGGTGLTSPGTSGNVLTSNGTDWVSSPAPATGVTAVSIATANGFAGTSSGGSTPILTMSTSITGLLQGNGTAVSAVTIGSGLSFSSGTLSATAQSSLGQTRAIAINCILP